MDSFTYVSQCLKGKEIEQYNFLRLDKNPIEAYPFADKHKNTLN